MYVLIRETKQNLEFENYFCIQTATEYQNHWSSESESNQIRKLDAGRSYEIVDVEKFKTQFGVKYVLVADDGSKHWTNNKLNEFINSNKNIKTFHLTTLEAKSFKAAKGEVSYIPVEISW